MSERHVEWLAIGVAFLCIVMVISTAQRYDERHDQTLQLLCAAHPEITCEAAQ